MGGKKKYNNQPKSTQNGTSCKEQDDEKKFVNLLPLYTIYKQKFRRLTKEEFKKILRENNVGKKIALDLCKEFMKSKSVPEDVDFSRNIGYLNLPRIMPLIALLAERAEYKLKPCLVAKVNFSKTSERFRKKFSYLMVYGYWYLGRVISDSLSVKEQVNRGNMFNFTKGDLGYWWAGVRILDWSSYAQKEKRPVNCLQFARTDPPKYRFYSSRAIINMGQDPKYFLSELDWDNFMDTINRIRHRKVISDDPSSSSSVDSSLDAWSGSDTDSVISSLSSCHGSPSSLVSKESID